MAPRIHAAQLTFADWVTLFFVDDDNDDFDEAYEDVPRNKEATSPATPGWSTSTG